MRGLERKSYGGVVAQAGFFVLVLFLCVLGLRVTHPESTQITMISGGQSLGNDGLSLILSAVLIIGSLVWVSVAVCGGKESWRITWMEVGVGLFATAWVVGVFFASDKRAAITDLVTMLGPMAAAMVLVQVLDSLRLLRLVLMVIVALGAVCAYQCADQFFSSNAMMIKQYEEHPEEQLGQFGIGENEFKRKAYEHRLYSKDVRGFFATGNSAGSFFLLAIFACIGLAVTDRAGEGKSFIVRMLLYAMAGGVCVFGLLLTHSKGAIGAGVVAGGLGVFLRLFGGLLRRHWRVVLLVCVIGAVGVVWVVVSYGMEHDTLPGGNSMLVRWQYWVGAWKMYAAKPYTGVGGGNFGNYYTHYKIAAAPETVKDPHCFALSILSQYGPVGLVGFVGAIGMLAVSSIGAGKRCLTPLIRHGEKSLLPPLITVGAVVAGCMLVFRPLLIGVEQSSDIAVMVYVGIFLFVVPVVFFVISYLLLFKAESMGGGKAGLRGGVIAIFCGVFGVLLHNLIDFAIFEPGVLTTFWVMAACLGAMGCLQGDRRIKIAIAGRNGKIATVLVCSIAAYAFFAFAFVPTLEASRLRQNALHRRYESHELLDLAGQVDELNGEVLNLNGRFYVQHWEETGRKNSGLLEFAARCFKEAALRDRANFNNYEKLRGVYENLSEVSADGAKGTWLSLAYSTGKEAVDRYPGAGRLWYSLGKIAEKLGKGDEAAEHFAKAVAIEDSYREQFKVMYPGRDMVSRLGEAKYAYAKEKSVQGEKNH